MSGKNVIEINGRMYDAISGMPVPSTAHVTAPPVSQAAPPSTPPVQRVASPVKKPHAAQKSTTLRRDAVTKPTGPHADMVTRAKRQPHQVPKSPNIHKFATHTPLSNKPVMQDVAPIRSAVAPQLRAARPVAPVVSVPNVSTKPAPTHHPSSIHALATAVHHEPAPSLPAVKKEAAISQAMNKAEAHKAAPHKHKKVRTAPKVVSVVMVTMAIAILTGYVTYLTMPGLSMRIAASQAGVAATYPEFQPSGYHFDGPITFASGEVTAQFKSNTDDSFYAIKQRKSPWDSQAVLDNYVAKQSSRYVTLTENGITVYTFDNKAAWVNGGVLYTLGGSARLSNDQVMKIATSM